jgi:glyoxylase-like metal-dependent hydrolase (beta-lactamase superfamily II)/8-oxo-dGTP pyrophosphatase MutT (NUDIX family)
MSASTEDPRRAEPRPASTVVPLRDSDHGLELLITVRPRSMRFMGGATVFPGGAVSDSDRDPRWDEASMLSAEEAAERLGEPDPRTAVAAYICAMREAFEEVGFIAGHGPVERLERSDAGSPTGFLDACLRHGVRLASELLHPAGRWITPLGSSIRFDARFFIVEAPAGWEPAPDPGEVAECRWITAEDALDDFAEGRAVMAPPTVEMLQILKGRRTSRSVIDGLKQNKVGEGDFILRAPVAPLTELLLAPNPSLMTGPGTNTYVVGDGPRAVVDPGVDDPAFIEAVMEAAGEIGSILVTHRHPDHVGGIEALVKQTGAVVRAFGQEPAGGMDVVPLEDEEEIEVPGTTLKALHTPGHASDHLCFLMDRWLFAGDNVLGEGTSVIAPPEGSMSAYLKSLRRLRELPIENLLTGHFRPLDDAHRVIDRYIEHRLEREQLIVDALRSDATSLDEIVASAYSDTPKELHPVARHSALAHLEMLEEAGRVERLPGESRLKSDFFVGPIAEGSVESDEVRFKVIE